MSQKIAQSHPLTGLLGDFTMGVFSSPSFGSKPEPALMSSLTDWTLRFLGVLPLSNYSRILTMMFLMSQGAVGKRLRYQDLIA